MPVKEVMSIRMTLKLQKILKTIVNETDNRMIAKYSHG